MGLRRALVHFSLILFFRYYHPADIMQASVAFSYEALPSFFEFTAEPTGPDHKAVSNDSSGPELTLWALLASPLFTGHIITGA